MREKLTDNLAAKAGPGVFFDTDRRSPRGFMLRVTPAGSRTWCLNYRVRDTGRERRLTLGDVASWPIAAARARAHELRREIDAGADPLGEAQNRRAAATVAELAERFIKESLPTRARSTQLEYRAMLRDWILPAIGKLKVAEVDREDIERLHRRITAEGKQRRANSVKAVCSLLFNQSIIWSMRETNPCRLIRANRENGRERYLSSEEITQLVAVLDRWRPRRPDSCDAVLMALATGARRGEIVSMRWADVDLDAGIWAKPAQSTKQHRSHRVPLSEAVVAVLRRRLAEREAAAAAGKIVRLRGEAADHVFVGHGSKAHVSILERDWRELRAAAGLEDVRFHDLRHSFASLLVAEGLSLPIIGAMLGHSRVQTTARYSHLALSPLRQAAEVVGRIVGGGKTK